MFHLEIEHSYLESSAKALISAIKTPSESLNVSASPAPLAVSAERVTALPLDLI